MSYLYYYTVGNREYFVDILYLSIKSLRYYSNHDILVIIDKQFKEKTVNKLREFSNIIICECDNSNTPEISSMRKLQIFDYNVEKYDSVIFLDADILINTDIDKISSLINKPDNNLLSVPIEHYKPVLGNDKTIIDSHNVIFWSLKNYTNEELNYLNDNNIHVFNTGLFGFKPNEIIKKHFSNIITYIKNYDKEFFYEQSFMNYYFNLKCNTTDKVTFNDSNYRMSPKLNEEYKNKIIHFTLCPDKYQSMLIYINNFMKYIYD